MVGRSLLAFLVLSTLAPNLATNTCHLPALYCCFHNALSAEKIFTLHLRKVIDWWFKPLSSGTTRMGVRLQKRKSAWGLFPPPLLSPTSHSEGLKRLSVVPSPKKGEHISCLYEIQLHWSLVQQEEGLALIKTKVGNKTETFISCSWQEQLPVLSILSEDSPPSKHIDWSRKQLDLTLLAFKTHFVRCAEAETSVHQLHHSAAAQQGK